MKILSGVGLICRLLIFLCLIQSSTILNAQTIEYNPDQVFEGSHFSLELSLIPYARSEYIHRSGYEHRVESRPHFSYEIGFKWRHYLSKSWSLEAGLMAGGRRFVKIRADLSDPAIVSSVLSDPSTSNALTRSSSDGFDRFSLPPQFSFPIQIGYHQYLGETQRHVLDFKLGVAIRVHIPGILEGGHGSTTIESDSIEVHIWHYRFSLDWHPERILSADLQSYFGYTFIPKNRHAISVGLMANFAFQNDAYTTKYFRVLPWETLEGRGDLKMVHHYLAINIGYTFTTKRNTLAVKKKKKKRSTGVY